MSKRTANVNGVLMFTSGDMVVKAASQKGSFEPKSMQIWAKIAESKGTMLDIGAYTGIYAISAALKGARSIAIEPNIEAVKRLRLNATLNKVDVEVHQMAAFSYPSRAELHLRTGNSLTSTATLFGNSRNRIKVKAVPVDMFNYQNVTAMKIDAERSEIQILRGAMRTLEEFEPVLLIEELDADTNFLISMEIGYLGYRSEQLGQSMSIWRT